MPMLRENTRSQSSSFAGDITPCSLSCPKYANPTLVRTDLTEYNKLELSSVSMREPLAMRVNKVACPEMCTMDRETHRTLL